MSLFGHLFNLLFSSFTLDPILYLHLMKILLLESFYTSSHKQWADGLIDHSNHEIELLSLPGRHWKWRMHYSGKYFAFEVPKLDQKFDLILCSDLMNVAEFRGILSTLGNSKSWFNNVPVITYFHENQITYPWSETDPDPSLKRDNHYGWINYISCLASDYILFNSYFHQESFMEALPTFIKQFPHETQDNFIDSISLKSEVLPIGLDLNTLASYKKKTNSIPTILWNHRWEYDKNPQLFYEAISYIKNCKLDFHLIVAGEKYKKYPAVFDKIKLEFEREIVHFGYAKDRASYISLLQKSDILPVTSNQDFFGISAIEAIAAGCAPLLPNRLAFPEHLDTPELKTHYYNNAKELFQKLKNEISNFGNETSDTQSHILKYDFENIIPMYDAYFQNKLFDFIS